MKRNSNSNCQYKKPALSPEYWIFTTLFIFFSFNNNLQAQGNEEWLILDGRMECVITNAAKEITGDDQHTANRYYEFDNELVDPALAWDWNITNPYTGDFDHWISGATFKFALGDTSSANKWWNEQGLDNPGYDDSQGAIDYWDVKLTSDSPEGQELNFHREKDVVIKYRGFEGVGLEGSMWLKKGRFIFKVGNITKTTKKSLLDSFLVPSMEHIYYQAKECHLFDPISNVGSFSFIGFNDTHYQCIEYVEVFILDENNQLMTDFVDQVSVSLFQNDILLNTWKETAMPGTPYSWIPIQNKGNLPKKPYLENLRYEISYKDVVSTSEPFSLQRRCSAKFSDYPESINYGQNISISVIEEELTEDQTFNWCDAFDIAELVQGWEGDIEEEDGYTLSYTCPPESELEGAVSLRFILHSCGLFEADLLDEIYIPIEDATVEPTKGFDDIYIFGGEDQDYGASIAAGGDPTEIFIAGGFQGVALFGDDELLSDGEYESYIGKWNYLTNSFEWIRKYGSSEGVDQARTVEDHGTSEIDCTIISEDSVKVKGSSKMVITPPGKNVVNTRLGQDGEVRWMVASGQIESETPESRSEESYHIPMDTKSDTNGNTIITGYYKDNISFTGADGISNWSSSGSLDVNNLFLVKISNDGEILWGFSASGSDDVKGTNLEIDSNGNVYLTASYIQPPILENYEFHDDDGAFIAKFHSEGDLLWLKEIRYNCNITGMVLDNDEENFFITGRAKDYCNFAGMVWEDSPYLYTELFFAKFSVDGEPIWIKHGETSSEKEEHHPLDMAIDQYDNFYITGYFARGNLAFSHIDLVPLNPEKHNHIIFAAAFDENGDVLWADKAADNPVGKEDSYDDQGNGIIIDGQNNCYITGTFKDEAEFGEELITGYGREDAFISKIIGGEITGIDENEESKNLEKITLFQNYPNPFRNSTRIDYILEEKENVEISIFNPLGEKTCTLFNKVQFPGEYSFLLNTKEYLPGIYYYQLRTNNRRKTKKMILIR